MPEKSKPRRRRTSPPAGRVGRLAAIMVSLLFVAVAFLIGLGTLTDILGPVTTDVHAPTVLVSIPPGATAKEIGAILTRKHLVRRPSSFVLAARIDGLSGKMKSGRYELSPAMPARQMALVIALGQTATNVITIPEGFTVRQIARRLAKAQLANESAFLQLAQTQGKTFATKDFTPPTDNLEGYLFPETYTVPKGTSERDIIALMLGQFVQRVWRPYGAELQASPGGADAAITLASLVEREAETDDDRPKIAAALRNRLAIGMRLECDATIQYALPEHKSRLFYRDLRVNSPYNTYRHKGLPPTPIANPGLPSILAALHPASVDYLFYVAGPDGKHHIFSRTLAAHNQAVARMRALRGRT